MEKIKKVFRYIYWIFAHQNYRIFGESGDNGVYVIAIFIMSIIFFLFSVIRVLLFDNESFTDVSGYNFKNIFKLSFLIIGFTIYYVVRKKTKHIPIKNNPEFLNISKKKRIFHTIIFFILWLFSAVSFVFILNLANQWYCIKVRSFKYKSFLKYEKN